MTNDELERAIDFLLKSQANLDARIERTNEQLAQTSEQVVMLGRHVGDFADTQAGIMKMMTRTFEAQAEINDSFRVAITELATRQTRTEDSITRLAEAQIDTNHRLDTLIDIVQGGLGRQ
jgi:hypothetical protein